MYKSVKEVIRDHLNEEVTQEELLKKKIFVDYDTAKWATQSEVMNVALRDKGIGSLVAIAAHPKSMQEIHLFELKPYDQRAVQKVKLRPGEQIFRFGTRNTVAGGMLPFVKVNVLKNLMYFLTQESSEGETDAVVFETKPLKLKSMRMTFDVATRHGVI